MILCCGEALIDMLPRTGPEGEELLLPVTGGAVFNTAIALGRLGAPTAFFSGLSTDKFGRMLIADLEESNVDHTLSIRSDNLTTLACVDLDGGEATYTFYDEGSAGRMLNIDDLPAIPQTVEAMLFGGISLIPEPCGSTYETLLARNAAGKVTYLDPNIRAGFIQNEESHRARIRRMIAMSDIVKVSTDDLTWIEPDMSEDEAVKAWLEGATNVVLLSRGADGAEAHTQNGITSVPAEPIDVIDTVGAGDTFNAGFLASLADQDCLDKGALGGLSSEQVKAALSFAAKTAAVTASRAGANPPWREEL